MQTKSLWGKMWSYMYLTHHLKRKLTILTLITIRAKNWFAQRKEKGHFGSDCYKYQKAVISH